MQYTSPGLPYTRGLVIQVSRVWQLCMQVRVFYHDFVDAKIFLGIYRRFFYKLFFGCKNFGTLCFLAQGIIFTGPTGGPHAVLRPRPEPTEGLPCGLASEQMGLRYTRRFRLDFGAGGCSLCMHLGLPPPCKGLPRWPPTIRCKGPPLPCGKERTVASGGRIQHSLRQS